MKKRKDIKPEFVLKTRLANIVRLSGSSVGTGDAIAADFNPGEQATTRQ